MEEWTDWYDTVGQIQRLARAYWKEGASDLPNSPSPALCGYLRCVRREPDVTSAAVAVGQIRDLLSSDWTKSPTVDILERLSLPMPTENRSTRQWLETVATLIEQTIEEGKWPPDDRPITMYEWITSYPDLHGIVSNAYHQDAQIAHASLEQALNDVLSTSNYFSLARAVGQVNEILAFGLAEELLAAGMRFLGSAHLPAPDQTYSQWLFRIAEASLEELTRRRRVSEVRAP